MLGRTGVERERKIANHDLNRPLLASAEISEK
jgi:hypothetical protein